MCVQFDSEEPHNIRSAAVENPPLFMWCRKGGACGREKRTLSPACEPPTRRLHPRQTVAEFAGGGSWAKHLRWRTTHMWQHGYGGGQPLIRSRRGGQVRLPANSTVRVRGCARCPSLARTHPFRICFWQSHLVNGQYARGTCRGQRLLAKPLFSSVLHLRRTRRGVGPTRATIVHRRTNLS